MQWDIKLKLDQLRRHFGWEHLEGSPYFDAWLTSFLENKSYDMHETIAKLDRRLHFEETELWNHEVAESMRKNLMSGSLHEIGEDLEGNTVLYVVGRRDFPTSNNREDRRRNLDMIVSYATRLRPRAKNSGGFTLLVNQEGAGVWANTDVSFSSTVAIRLSKYWPGALQRIVLVKMSSAISALLKPVLAALPTHIGSRVVVMSERDLTEGKLLRYFPPEIVPGVLGGHHRGDTPEDWAAFAERVYDHYHACVDQRGLARSFTRDLNFRFSIVRQECEQHMASIMAATPEPYFTAHANERENVYYDCATIRGSEEAPESELCIEMVDVWASVLRHSEAEEAYCRSILTSCEEDLRVELAQLLIATKRDVEIDAAPERFAYNCPVAPRAAGRVVLWFCCLLIAAYFTVATLFVTLFVVAMMTTMFFSLFHNTQETIACMLGILLVGHQGALTLTRGAECIYGAYKGRSVLSLGTTQSWFGCWVQSGVWAIVLVISCVIFFVYETDNYSLSTGVEISFAWGWIGCAVALILYQFIFPTPLVQEQTWDEPTHTRNTADPRDTRVGLLSIYLLLNVTEPLEYSTDTAVQRKDKRYRLGGVALFASVSAALGVAHILSGDIIVLIFACFASVLTALFSNYMVNFSKSMRADLSRHVMLTLTWTVCMLWVYVVCGLGALGMGTSSSITIIVLCVTVFCYIILFLWVRWSSADGSRQMAFRAAYFYLCCMVLGCIVVAFTITWGLGVFFTVLFVHCTACYTMRHGTRYGTIGVLVLGFLILGVVVVALAYTMRATIYYAPMSQEAYIASGLTPYPMCTRKYGAASLSITDFAFFCNLAHSENATAMTIDLVTWFPNFTLVQEGRLNDGAVVRMFAAPSMNNTLVVSIRGPTDLSFLIQATAGWVEALAFAPLAYVLPQNWTANLVYTTSFLHRMFTFPSVNDVVTNWINTTIGDHYDRENVYFTGYEYGGWLAQIAGSRIQVTTFAFASPGVMYTLNNLQLNWYNVIKYIVNIVPTSNPVASIDSHDGAVQPMTCEATSEDINACTTLSSVTCELLRSCGTTRDRSISLCS